MPLKATNFFIVLKRERERESEKKAAAIAEFLINSRASEREGLVKRIINLFID